MYIYKKNIRNYGPYQTFALIGIKLIFFMTSKILILIKVSIKFLWKENIMKLTFTKQLFFFAFVKSLEAKYYVGNDSRLIEFVKREDARICLLRKKSIIIQLKSCQNSCLTFSINKKIMLLFFICQFFFSSNFSFSLRMCFVWVGKHNFFSVHDK